MQPHRQLGVAGPMASNADELSPAPAASPTNAADGVYPPPPSPPPHAVAAESDGRRTTPAKRRRTATSTSARGVANLNPEQLARKRANDREAQRAIRERTRNHIERLNQRIRELESQQPFQDMQLMRREKEAFQAENEDLRRRMASALELLQPSAAAPAGLNGTPIAFTFRRLFHALVCCTADSGARH